MNYIIRFEDKKGNIRDLTQRKEINFGDMIIVGDHNGPCSSSPKFMGVIIASLDAREFDLAFAKTTGFDDSIPMINAINKKETDYLFGQMGNVSIVINGDNKGDLNKFGSVKEWKYRPHDMWVKNSK